MRVLILVFRIFIHSSAFWTIFSSVIIGCLLLLLLWLLLWLLLRRLLLVVILPGFLSSFIVQLAGVLNLWQIVQIRLAKCNVVMYVKVAYVKVLQYQDIVQL